MDLAGVKVGNEDYNGIIELPGILSRQVRMELMQLPLQLERWQGRDLILLGDLYAGVER